MQNDSESRASRSNTTLEHHVLFKKVSVGKETIANRSLGAVRDSGVSERFVPIPDFVHVPIR